MAGGTWAGAERATGGIVNTGMRLLEFGAQQRQYDERLAMERERLKMAQDLANKQGRIAEIQAKQAEDDAKLIDVDAHFTQMGHGPEEIAYLKSKAMLDIENINGRDYIQTKRGREIWAGLVNDPQTTVDLAAIKAQRADKQIADMTNQLYGEGAAKLKPEQRAELEQQYDALVQQRTAYAEATKIANRALMAKNKERMQTVQKPDGSWASVDPVSGQTFDLPGTPEGIVKDAQRSKTKADLIESSLEEKLGRAPTATEIIAEQQRLDIEIAKNRKAATVNIGGGGRGGGGAGGLSADALQVEGIKFATTGQMPSLGMGNANIRMKIINAAAEYIKEQGIDPRTVPGLQAEYRGVAQAFRSVKAPLANFEAFERALIKNADYAFALSKQNFRTQLPPANAVLNAIKTNTGDPKIVKFGAAIYAAAMEYEKIRTAGTNVTSAELSIGAQKKAEEILNKAQTHAQLRGVIEAMKVDSKNVVSSRREVLGELSGELRKMDQNFGGGGAGGNVTHKYVPGKGIVRVR
jgi:hypothetical protein